MTMTFEINRYHNTDWNLKSVHADMKAYNNIIKLSLGQVKQYTLIVQTVSANDFYCVFRTALEMYKKENFSWKKVEKKEICHTEMSVQVLPSSKFSPSFLASFLVDQIIGGLFIGPLTAASWWGIWTLLDNHLYPENPDLSGYVCFAIGNGGLMFLVFSQNLWKKFVRLENRVQWIFGYHFYTCVYFFFNVCHWRGLWKLLDVYTGVGATSAWSTYGIGQILLLLLRATKNAKAPPMMSMIDTDPDFFTYTTRFRVKVF